MRTKFIALAATLGIISNQASASPETEFWKWFQQNEISLYDFESDQERIFDKLADQMHKVDPNLTFEFGPKQNSKREFVISADGIRASFPKVESLYAAAPHLKHWTFVKFRPRREPFDIQVGSVKLKPDDISILIERDGRKAGLNLFVSGYTPKKENEFKTALYLILDQALGEYDVETYVGFIEVSERANEPKQAITLDDLPKAFDRFIGR